MSVPLLATKLYFPPARINLVPRPRLVERLKTGLQGPLTLISAPAGYGKTTLMSEWRDGIGYDQPAAWLSLDADDNDLVRFLRYLASALDAIKAGLLNNIVPYLLSPQPPPVEPLLTTLINSLDSSPQDFTLILDDYQEITTLAIHEALTYLLDHLPSRMHLVILSRADPPLPLARWRARNQLTELRAEHLRFTADEAATFIRRISGVSVSSEDIALLEARSEGWAAGLQMAALSIQGREDAYEFIREFSGNNRYILDFLTEEVLDRQPEFIQQFLLQTSILDRMCPQLCNAVTERSDSQSILEKLTKSNLFITPLDNQRYWYRYHHLFADLLLSHLCEKNSDQIPLLKRRASEWHAQQDLMEEAIGYAISGNDYRNAAEMIINYAPSMSKQGRIAGISKWIGMLPEDILAIYPLLRLTLAWASYFEYNFEQAESCVRQLEQTTAPENTVLIDGELALLNGIFATVHGELDQSIMFLKQALAALPANQLDLRGRAWLFLGTVYEEINTYQAQQALQQALSLLKKGRYFHLMLLAYWFHARILILKGSLHQAASICQSALKLAEKVPNWPAASYGYSAIGMLKYEWNELESAASFLERAVTLAETGGNAELLFSAIFPLAKIYRAQGQWGKAQQLLYRAREIGRDARPLVHAQIDEEQVFLWLAQNKIEEAAKAVMVNYPPTEHVPILPTLLKQITWARAAIAQRQPQQALTLLSEIEGRAAQAGMNYLCIQILLLKAITLWDDRVGIARQESACELLGRAISLSSSDGLLRVFLDEGEPVRLLLKGLRPQFENNQAVTSYIDRLLSVYPDHSQSSTPSTRQPLVDPLSERELEVLRLLAAGKSNSEIASELVIAIGTAKRHISNIFGKLHAENRTQCVALARELQLL